MFEEEDDQNGAQSNNSPVVGRPYGFNFTPTALDDSSMADQISSGKMFAAPQVSGTNNGDFVNRGALQIDPDEPNAYSQFGLPATNTSTATQPAYLPPINPRDDQGKTLPKYRMGVGQRILGTVSNFLNGFARNGAAPAYVGPGALNNRYYQDEALRQQRNEESSSNVPVNTGTAPQDDGSMGTTTNFGLNPNSFGFGRNTSARFRLRKILSAKQPAKNSYAYTARNRRTGERIGSNDGVNWSNANDSASKSSDQF